MVLTSFSSLSSLLLAVSGASAPQVPGVDLSGLLDKAATRLAVPEAESYLQTETEEDLDGHGHTTAVRMTKSKQRLLPDGTQRGDVIEALENGYDVTGNVRRFRAEREKKTHGKRGPPIDIDLEFKLPFEGSQQARYRFNVIGGTALTPRVHFEPKGERHRLWVGDATLDAATGTILQLFGHPAILPAFVDQIDVHMEFNPQVPGGTLPERMVVEGGGHFLWFHKRMRYTSVTAIPPPTAAATPAPAGARAAGPAAAGTPAGG